MVPQNKWLIRSENQKSQSFKCLRLRIIYVDLSYILVALILFTSFSRDDRRPLFSVSIIFK